MATSTSSKSSRVLEKVDRRSFLDDTIPLAATILTFHVTPQGHVEYRIRVKRGPVDEGHWDVSHRYSEFLALHQTLQVSGINLDLPPKKMFGNTEKQFLSERQQKLQEYLNSVLQDPLLACSVAVKRFLDPANYSDNYHDIALRNVSMFFRSNPEWAIVQPLQDIGWRIRKHYYLINSKLDPKARKRILTYVEPGPDFCLSERDLEGLLKVLQDIEHPNILSPSSATYNGTGVLITRDYYPEGSLRDKIYHRRSGVHFLTKPAPSPKGSFVDIYQIKQYGRQILSTLDFLLEKGFLVGHVHAGNVIVDTDTCKLIDLENSLLGLPSFYRTFIIDIRKIQGPEQEAVYSFGHLLYEMACRQPLKTATMEAAPTGTHHEVVPILELLLSSGGVKKLPTIKELLSEQFFRGPDTLLSKPRLKVPSRFKDPVKAMREKVDTRLVDDQRKVVQVRRHSKAQETLNSEDEKQKRRKKVRREMSKQESIQEPEAYPVSQLVSKQPSSKSLTTTTTASTSSSKSSSSAGKTAAGDGKKTQSPSTTAKSASVAPPTSSPPESRPPPADTKRGMLLSSIEGFSKGKLKKSVTNDRSAPKL